MTHPHPALEPPKLATATDLTHRLEALPAMPLVRQELLNALMQERMDMPQVTALVQRDPVMAAKALRVANSSFFGLAEQVDSVQQAVALLGFRGVQSIALGVAVMGQFSPGASAPWFDERAHWRHSMAVALCAQALAGRTGQKESAAFTAGLLHDIGRLVLVVLYPQASQQAWALCQAGAVTLSEAERAVVGLDHAQATDLLARHWRLPPGLRDAMAWHHQPEHADAGPAAWLLHVADGLAHGLKLTGDPNEQVPPIHPVAWQGLNLDQVNTQDLLEGVEARFQQACSSLLDALPLNRSRS